MRTAILLVALIGCCLAAYTDLIKIPAAAGKNQNGYTYLKASTMLNLYGKPCSLTPNCKTVTNPSLSGLIQTRKIGKFTFTGMKQALDALSRAMDDVARNDAALYAAIGSSGMLCCRAIRGSTTTFSNHAWGAAVDINVKGVIDPRGDAKCQRGLAELWPFMAKQGFYWAAGYSGASEDSMHFEIANEVMLNWAHSGSWGTCKTAAGVSGSCIDTTQCKGKTESGRCPGPANIKCCYGVVPPPVYRCVTATTLNIRSGPCTSNTVLGTATEGQALTVVNAAEVSGCNYKWIQIRHNGVTGYVATTYVKACAALGASEFNSTIGDEPVEGEVFADGGDGGDEPYEDEDSVASRVYLALFAFVLLVALF